MVCAGLAFAWGGLATKLASDDLASGHLSLAVAVGASTAGGVGAWACSAR